MNTQRMKIRQSISTGGIGNLERAQGKMPLVGEMDDIAVLAVIFIK